MPFFERLFSDTFKADFAKMLSEEDKRKIALNEAVME
jgi:hypothetical protein